MHDEVAHSINTIMEILPTFVYCGITETEPSTPGMCICSRLQFFDLLMCPPGNNSNGSSSQLSSPQDTKRNMVTRRIEAFIVYLYQRAVYGKWKKSASFNNQILKKQFIHSHGINSIF